MVEIEEIENSFNVLLKNFQKNFKQTEKDLRILREKIVSA